MSTARRCPGLLSTSVHAVPFVVRIRTMRGLPPAAGFLNVGLFGLISTRSCHAAYAVPLLVTAMVGNPFDRKAICDGGYTAVENVG